MNIMIKLLTMILFTINVYSSGNLEKVSLQLDWNFQFQYAGFIMAKEKGFYKKAGLDVEEDILTEKVDFITSNTTLMAKDRLLRPVVLLATYLQRSPLVFITQPNIKKPSQLDGKKIMTTENEYKNSALTLLMEHFFIKGTYVPYNYNIEDFKDKKVDAMSIFTSNELYELDRQNIPYNIIDPYEYGFATSAMNLFSSHKFARDETKKVKKFIQASKKGWLYALDNTDETVKIILKKYNPNKTLEALRNEAKEIKSLMLLDLYEIGEIRKEQVMRVYKQLHRSGKILANQKNKIVFFDDILSGEENGGKFFNQKERDFLAKKGIIKLCVDPDWLPFEGFEDGKYIGMIAEYFELIREKSGINIEVHRTANWDESIEALKSRDCDIIGSASPTTSRME